MFETLSKWNFAIRASLVFLMIAATSLFVRPVAAAVIDNDDHHLSDMDKLNPAGIYIYQNASVALDSFNDSFNDSVTHSQSPGVIINDRYAKNSADAYSVRADINLIPLANVSQTASLTITKIAVPADGTDFEFASDVLNGIIDTVAGGGSVSTPPFGDGGQATNAQLNGPFGVAVDSAGNFFIADTTNHRIRRVAADTGIITTVAGNGTSGFSGDGGPATSAQLSFPRGVVVDSGGNLFIADSNNNRIRRVDAGTENITTVAGNGTPGFSGDGGQATNAQLNGPIGVTVDNTGNLFIADTGNQRIRGVDDSTGIISTVAGTGTLGSSGDGGPATAAQLFSPRGVAVDSAGNLFIADTFNSRIRQVFVNTGIITTVAGTVPGLVGDGGLATEAKMRFPSAVVVDSEGNLFIADTDNSRIRRVDASTGIISNIAGSGDKDGGFSGDGGPATNAQLNGPTDVVVDSNGDLFIADEGNNRIRQVRGLGGGITFTLDDADVDDGDGIAQTIAFNNLVVGTYQITETLPTDWQLESASCTGGSDTGSLTDETLSVTLGTDEAVTCTFTNIEQPGIIVIEKDTIPNTAQDFIFTTTGGLSPTPFTLDDDADGTLSNTQTFTNVRAGSYSITETATPGYDTSLNCVDPSGGTTIINSTANIDLAPGETVTCTFTNTAQPGTIIIVKDTMPDAAQDFAFTTSGGLSPTTFNLDDDANGTLTNTQTFTNVSIGSYSVTEKPIAGYNISLNCNDPSGGTTTTGNTANIDLGAGETVTCTFTNIKQTADLEISKFVSGPDAPLLPLKNIVVDANDVISYSIVITNTGPDVVPAGTVITDILPDEVTHLDSISVGGAGGATVDTSKLPEITITLAEMPAPTSFGTIQAVGIVARVNAGTGGQQIVNTTQVITLTQDDPITINNTSTATVTVRGADLALSKTVSDEMPSIGDTITYTVAVINNGPDTTDGVVISDTFPAQLMFENSTTTSGNYNSTTGVWVVNDAIFANGEVHTLTLQATVPVTARAKTITNTASIIQSTAEDGAVANNIDSVALTVQSSDLSITKTSIRDNSVSPNGVIYYTIIVQNNGPSAADGAVVSDLRPANVADFAWSCNATNGAFCANDSGTGILSEVIPSFPVNGRVTYSITASLIVADAVITNTAVVTTVDEMNDPTDDNNTAVNVSGPSSNTYLPIVFKDATFAPDLVVDSVTATENSVTVIIRNQGNAPVVDAFWVDVYFDPSKEPEVNDEWDAIANQGVAWGLVGSDLPIGIGQSLELTLANATPGEFLTSPPPYPAGATVYALVDSIDYSTNYGAVQESDETNNLAQSTVSAVSNSNAPDLPAATNQSSANEQLPRR